MAIKTASTTAAPLPEPQEGGSYVRNADGSLTLTHQTQPSLGRAQRAQQAATAVTPVSTETPKE